MDINPDILKTGLDIGGTLAKNSVSSIMSKIKTVKASNDQEKVISNLEEIISDLISERNQLVQLIQSYEEKLITQKISEEDIDYITQHILPLIEELLNNNPGENADKAKEALALFAPLLSKELFNIAQLLGFNFKKAIGEPLTQLVNETILSKTSVTQTDVILLQIKEIERNIELFKIIQDEEAFKRYQSYLNNSE